jgi:hypothetical protein
MTDDGRWKTEDGRPKTGDGRPKTDASTYFDKLNTSAQHKCGMTDASISSVQVWDDGRRETEEGSGIEVIR